MAIVHNIEENSADDWAYLPANVLDQVLYNLTSFADFVRSAAVCKPWFNVAIESKKKISSHRQIPMLIVPSRDKNTTERSLYDITKGRYYNFSLNLSYAKRCCGSSYGWLATMEENSVITLINPFISGANSICLPPLVEKTQFGDYEMDEYDVHKLILSANPLECDDYMIAIITNTLYLAVFKHGDNDWTHFPNKKGLCDVTYYMGKFYATDQEGVIVSVGLNDDGGFTYHTQLVSVEPMGNSHSGMVESYIVESSLSTKDLLYIQRCMVADDENICQYTTSDFKVAKLKYTSDNTHPTWIEIDDLGDQAIFLGDNHSFSVVASEYPGVLQPNDIYFTDNINCIIVCDLYGPRDMGVFNLKNKSFKLHYTPDPSNKLLPPPIWIVPTIQGKLDFSFASSFVE